MFSKPYRYKKVQRQLNFLTGAVLLLIFYIFLSNFNFVSDFFKFDKWIVSDWIYSIQTIVITISVLVAYKTIQASKQVSKEAATLEIILADNKDKELIEANSDLLLFLKNPDKFYKEYKIKNPLIDSAFSSDSSQESSSLDSLNLTLIIKRDKDTLTPAQEDIRTKMLTVLSRHEFYAIGLNAGLLDEGLFKRMHCTNFVSLWEQVSPAINQLREKEKKDTFFKDFEILALRWKADPLVTEDIIRSPK